MRLFKKKNNKIDVLIEKLNLLNKKHYHICYFDNSNINPVREGKLPLYQGWYIKTHNNPTSQVTNGFPMYENIIEAILSIGE